MENITDKIMIYEIKKLGYDSNECLCEQMLVFGKPTKFYTVCTDDGEILGIWNSNINTWIELYV